MIVSFFTLYSLEEFLVDDDDEDLEEEVFEDPGYQEEFDFGSDKENDDCIEIATPGRLPFLKRINPLGTKANLVLDLLTKFLNSSTFFGQMVNMKKNDLTSFKGYFFMGITLQQASPVFHLSEFQESLYRLKFLDLRKFFFMKILRYFFLLATFTKISSYKFLEP